MTFHHQMKHPAVHLKYSAVRRIFNSLSISSGDFLKILRLFLDFFIYDSFKSILETGERLTRLENWEYQEGANGGTQFSVNY